MLNVASFVPSTTSLGPGNRAVIWLQGCQKRCKGCCNPHMHDIRIVELISIEKLSKLILSIDNIEGITIVGGEPLLQAKALSEFISITQKTRLSIMLYSGYTLKYLCMKNDPCIDKTLDNCDVFVDGEYRHDEDNGEPWRGSANQKVHFFSNRYSIHDSHNCRRTSEVIYDASNGCYQIVGYW